jgi:hypothetical protein
MGGIRFDSRRLAVMATSFVAAIAGCIGDSGNGEPPIAGLDASVDTGTVAPLPSPKDATVDSVASDASVVDASDATVPDAPAEAAVDSGPEASLDAAGDAAVDSGTDAADASGGDGAADAATDAQVDAADAGPTVIGPNGGTVAGPNGALAIIPAGALTSDVGFSIQLGTDVDGDGGTFPVYRFLPPTIFARPVTIVLPVTGTAGSLYWSQLGSASGYDSMGGVVSGGTISTNVVHFGAGYAGAATATRTVVGSNIDVYLSSTFENAAPDDMTLPTEAVSAIVFAGDGGAQTYPGKGFTDGTFRIPGVPVGPYTIRKGTGDYYARSIESALDVGSETDGRIDAQSSTSASSTTSVTLTMTNLEPWASGDAIDWVSSQVALWDEDVETDTSAKNVPAAGATSLASFQAPVRNHSTSPALLIQGSKGDALQVMQLATSTTSTGVSELLFTREFDAPSFDATFGADSPFNGAFAAVTLDHSVVATVSVSEYYADPTDFGPGTAPTSGTIHMGVYAVPFTTRHGGEMNTPRLSELSIVSSPMGTDVTTGAISYGMPAVGTWTPIFTMFFHMAKNYALPGLTPTQYVFDGATDEEPLGNPDMLAVHAAVTPPRNVKMNGTLMTSPLTGVGTMPVVTWDPPRVGTPSGYRAYLSQLTASGSATTTTFLANLNTETTSVQIPPGLLTAGGVYLLEIRARHKVGLDLAASPERDSLPGAGANCVTETFSP